MKAKEFLQQLLKIDRQIENKQDEQEHWKSVAAGTASKFGTERVQSSGNPDKMADAIGKYIELEKEITQEIDRLIDKRREITGTIEQLNYMEYDILYKIYVKYISFDDVAIMYGKSYSWVTTIHGKALKNLQKILDEREIHSNE